MTIADKALRAKEDYDTVYEAGKQEGYGEGYTLGHDHGEQYGKELGKQEEYDAFWDNFQQSGNCHNYDSAFRGDFFNDAIYNPAYPIIASDTYGASYMYMNNKRLTDTKVTVSVPGLGNGMVFYQASRLKRIPTLEISDKTTFSSWFAGCSALEELNIVGEIAQNEFDVHWSTKLSRDSIVSVVNALSPTTTGLTVTLSETAVENAFENNRTAIPFGLTCEQEGADVTATDNGDGTATLNGTIECDTYFLQSDPTAVFSAGLYALSLPPTDYGTVHVTLYDLDGKWVAMYDEWNYGEEVTFTANEDFVMKAQLYLMGSATFDNAVVAYPTLHPDFEALKASKPNWTIALA